jgi:hypothetical protein
MAAPAKVALYGLVSAVLFVMITQAAIFFPFYMTVVLETFNIANIAANDNYVKQTYYDDALDNLRSRPIFSKSPASVRIDARRADIDYVNSAVGNDDEFYYDENNIPDNEKPYRQRGERITVTVSADYALETPVWSTTIITRIPVSFSMTTIGLKYYKDLPLD